MKQLRCGLLVLLFLFASRIPAQAYSIQYTDNMTDLYNSTIKQYQNLSPVSQVSGYPAGALSEVARPMGGALTFTSREKPLGWVDYRVRGADTVTVSFYTWRGSFVSLMPAMPDFGTESAYVLGVYQDNMGHLSSQQMAQALYSRSTGEVYSRADGSLRRASDFKFVDPVNAPSDLIDYAVNVYAGSDANNLKRISLPAASAQNRNMRYSSANHVCYEQLSYPIPPGTAYVRVEINDWSWMNVANPGVSGSVRPPTNMRTTLTEVAFQGSDLKLGIPDPLENTGTLSQSSSQAQEKVSSRSSASAQAGSSTAAGTSQSAASKSASSKFTGQVRASEKANTPKGSAPSVPVSEKPETENSEETQWETPLRERTEVIHLTPRGTGKKERLIGMYIAGMGILILILLLRGKKE